MLDRFTSWKKETAPTAAARPDAASQARLRAGLWVEFKRLHLGFGQALNAVTYGHSNTLALVRHAMLAEHEAQKLRGLVEGGGPDLTVGEAMRQAIMRCQGAYGRINASAFDEKALAGLAEDSDPHLIALMLNLTTAPFRTADGAVADAMKQCKLDDHERAARFTPEILNLHKRLREHFSDLAQRAGLA